ncbi:unnamed protein product [Linum tenue]|uniref:Aminotransferase-like plant mobile domain-containing protein n=1 Tax=Linum tenue TaxID=586396 RepID=A0AAV0RXK5_9ROSI|nr:unnamed protein product [Linum tenue]CAI0619681.1 unnamed protein product [Linum tenue]
MSRDRLRPAINVFLIDQRRVGSKSICDFLTLLQSWIYDYFSLFRPSQIPQAPDAPRASSWVCHRFAGGDDARQRLVRYREMLDGMSREDVSWTPYGRDAGTEVLCSLYTGFIRFADVAKGSDPARCHRQFGY